MRITRGRPPKNGKMIETERLEIRAEKVMKRLYENAAQLADLDLSEWIRNRLNAAAKRELNKASKKK